MRVDTSPKTAKSRRHPPALANDCALFLDVDGTLAEHVARPDDVTIDAELMRALPGVAVYLGHALALVTGRSIAGVDRLFPRLILPMAGQHGSERRDANGVVHAYAPDPDTYGRMRKSLQSLAGRHAGVFLEDKGSTLALHNRDAPQLAGHIHRVLRSFAATIGGGSFGLQPGKWMLELRSRSRDKGTAIAEFMSEAPFAGRRPVFVGDDRADEHGFAVVDRAGGWSVKVGTGRTDARYRLPDIAAVRRWVLAPIVHGASN